jgi:hypothetical protein
LLGLHLGSRTGRSDRNERRREEMKKSIILLVCSLVLSISSFTVAETQWNIGVSGGPEGISGFHISVGNHYRVPEREVMIIRERGIHDEELPVVFFLCKHTRVSPEVIVTLRLSGWSWYKITTHLGLTPEIYYVPVVIYRDGPPYGRAYGYYKNHPRERWSTMEMTDVDIVNQVNLHFISNQYGYEPGQIMKMREMGTSFVNIERKVYREKAAKENHQEEESRSIREPSRGSKEREWKDDDRIPPGKRKKMKD